MSIFADHCFVYGTLIPGCVRWSTLAQFADGPPVADEVVGTLYDTGCGFPAAVLGGPGAIHGYTVALHEDVHDLALAVLDRIEGEGHLYERRRVTTANGTEAWIYHWPHSTDDFTPIEQWTTWDE